MHRAVCILAFIFACWPALSGAGGERQVIDVQHYIDMLTPISERQKRRIAQNCEHMALFGVMDNGLAGLISEIPADRCRQQYELSTETVRVILEEYLAGARALACKETDKYGRGGPKDEYQQNFAIYCETGTWEYSTDPRNGTTKEVIISVTEFLIMPALVCAAAAREIAPEQQGGYCTSSAPPADSELLWPWGRLIGQAGLLPLNNFGSIRDDACASYPSGDPAIPATSFFADVLGDARDSAAMVSRLEALHLECGPPDKWGLGTDEKPDVVCSQSYFPGARWHRSDTNPAMIRAESFSDSLRLGIFDDAEKGETRICITVASGGI